jgi:hypothetical protein
MLQFDKISVNKILVFSEVVNEYSLLQKDFIEEQYQRIASNFGQTVEFLRELDWIEVTQNQIILKPKYKDFLKNLNESHKPRETVKKVIIGCLAGPKTSFSEYFYEFFSRFRLINEHYEFTPTVSERLKYSGLRNFLMDLGWLYLDSSETKYIVVNDYSMLCSELQASYQLHPSKFLKMRLANEEIGKAAELKIIEYEKERLSRFPHLAEKIEHTAKYDVRAGYDIKSYEMPAENGPHKPKYIEVKAVSLVDFQFIWSINEVEKSGLYRQNYYLYLLPVKGENEFDMEHLKIINDPYINILNNKDEWTKTVESFSFSLIPSVEK